MGEKAQPRAYRWRPAAWWAALIGGSVLFATAGTEFLTELGSRHFELGLAVLGAIAGLAWVAWRYLEHPPHADRYIVLGAVVLVLSALFLTASHGHRPTGTVHDYCAYGATSEGELENCVDHMTEDEVDGRAGNAARFGRRELEQCLADSGPLCDSTLQRRRLEDQNPPPKDSAPQYRPLEDLSEGLYR